MRLLCIICCISCLLTPLASNGGTDTSRILLTGSSTLAPLMLEIAKRYESKHKEVRIDVQTGGSSRGIADVRRGLADIGMISRSLKSNEEDLMGYVVALDGICIILHKQNKVTSLTIQQIVDIYTGKIENWKVVGGNDGKITVVHKAEGRSTLELFLKNFGLNNSDVKPHVIIGDNQQGIKTVAGNQNSIGYVSIGAAEYANSTGTPVKLLPMNGVDASVANVLNGSYPLSRQLILVTKKDTNAAVLQFIKYTQRDEVDDLIKAQFFVPITHR